MKSNVLPVTEDLAQPTSGDGSFMQTLSVGILH